MELVNGRLRIQVDHNQILILLESLMNKGYQVCCDWDWHQVSRHTTVWYFIFDRKNYRFMELYYDGDESWVLQESSDLIVQKMFPDRGEQSWRNIHSATQSRMTTRYRQHAELLTGSS